MAAKECSREGLSILKDANNPLEPLLDVVLVHGFGGHPVKTWSEDGVCWPAHVKPAELSSEDIPESLNDKDIRVLTFGYIEATARPYEGVKLSRIADGLLQSLRSRRPKELCPIVWVGHSSGGLVIKQALITAQRHGHHRDIFYSTHGVVFFATPHCAPDAVSASWGAIASKIYNATPQRIFGGKTAVPEQLVTDEDCKGLNAISRNFLGIAESETGIDLVSFEEKEEHWKLDKLIVVNRAPGLLFHTVVEVDRDHFAISRSGGDEAWDKIMDLATKSRRAQAFDRNDRKALGAINMSGIKAVQGLVEERTPGTCVWIEQQDTFRDWKAWQKDRGEGRQQDGRNHRWTKPRKDKRHDKLWIYGDLGCGKTQLAAHIVNVLESESQGSRDFVVFCSLHDVKRDRKAPETILACLIYQLLSTCRPVARMWLQRRGYTSIDILTWELDSLMLLWQSLVREISRRGCRATVIIDAVDECANSQTLSGEGPFRLLRCLSQSLLDNVTFEQTWRLLLLSRNTAEIKVLKQRDELQDFLFHAISAKNTKVDISATVAESVIRMIRLYNYDDNKLRSDMVHGILSKANGMYLWACVVVKEIAKKRRTPAKIRELLSRLPTGIIGLYEMILGGIRQDDQDKARNVLLWVAHQRQALTESEFQTAYLMTAAAKLPRDGRRSEACLERLSGGDIDNEFYDQEEVIGCCDPLVKFAEQTDGDPPCLVPIHHSVLEYLQTPAAEFRRKSLGKVRHQPGYYYSQEEGNSVISRLCTTYLLLPYFRNSGRPYDPKDGERQMWEEKVACRIDEHPFSQYAALHWINHGLGAGDAKQRFDPQTTSSDEYALLSLTDDTNAKVDNALCWAEIWWHANRKAEDFPGLAFRHPEFPDWGVRCRDLATRGPTDVHPDPMPLGAGTSIPPGTHKRPDAALFVPPIHLLPEFAPTPAPPGTSIFPPEHLRPQFGLLDPLYMVGRGRQPFRDLQVAQPEDQRSKARSRSRSRGGFGIVIEVRFGRGV